MGGAVQPVDALHFDGGRALARNLRAHPAQALRQIDNLGLACGIFDQRRALGQGRGHQHVFRGPYTGKPQRHPRTPQPATGDGMQIAVFQFNLGPQRLKRRDVDIHWPCANGTAPRQRHHSVMFPRQQWPQHQIGRPHLAHNVIVGAGRGDGMRRQRNHFAAL